MEERNMIPNELMDEIRTAASKYAQDRIKLCIENHIEPLSDWVYRQHFIEGAKWILDNPPAGALLYVNKKSYDLGVRDAFNGMWHKPEQEHPTIGRNCIVEMEDGHIMVARWDGTYWHWADGAPAGVGTDGDLIYSSWCSIDSDYNVVRWCYVQDLKTK